MSEQLTLFRGRDPTAKEIYGLFSAGDSFKRSINLYDTVRVNENFYIGE